MLTETPRQVLSSMIHPALEVPLPHQAFWVGHRRRSLSRGSGRSRSRRGRETRDDLKRLEKPINLIVAAQARGNLPADVVPLYKEICDTNDKDDIFPHEARKEVELLDPYTKDRYFRKPNPDPAGRARAKEMFTALSRIVGRAGDMQNTARSEASWNMFVHGPLLDLVYSGDLPRPDRADEVRVQWDYITTATIAGGSIPFFRSTAYQPAEPALTISTDTSVLSPSEEGSRLSLSQMRSSSVKVDFVLALNASEKTPLRRAISSIINHEDQAIPHVNQTAYQFLKDTPIAVSIETKKETTSTESIMQLGLWTAAWYKHMYGLREHLAGPGPKPSFGSILLIQIIGHTWQVYCVHDSSSSIDVRGPFLLGSTDGITSVYVLLKSLEAIRRWTEDTFYTSVQRWFLV